MGGEDVSHVCTMWMSTLMVDSQEYLVFKGIEQVVGDALDMSKNGLKIL